MITSNPVKAVELVTPNDFEEQIGLSGLGTQMRLMKFLQKNMLNYQREFLRSKLHNFSELFDLLPKKDWPKYFPERAEILERYKGLKEGASYYYSDYQQQLRESHPFSLEYIVDLYTKDYTAIRPKPYSHRESMALMNYGIDSGSGRLIKYSLKNAASNYKFIIDRKNLRLIWFKENWLDFMKFKDDTWIENGKIVDSLNCQIQVSDAEPGIVLQFEMKNGKCVSSKKVPNYSPHDHIELIFKIEDGNLLQSYTSQYSVY